MHSMCLLIICTASLMRVLEKDAEKGKSYGTCIEHLRIKLVDELQFASGRWMKPIQHYQTK